MYSPSEISAMNKTSRATGAVGRKALVPAFVSTLLDKYPNYTDKNCANVLDLGAGKSAAHVKMLATKHQQHLIVSAEIGSNFNKDIHNYCIMENLQHTRYSPLVEDFDIVYMSNVLNVQPSRETVVALLRYAKVLLIRGGTLVFNFPKSPRYNDASPADFVEALGQENLNEIRYGSGKIYVYHKK